MADFQAAADATAPRLFTGTVKFYDPIHEYGYILPDKGSGLTRDILFQARVVRKNGITHMCSGQRVEFEAEKNKVSGVFKKIDEWLSQSQFKPEYYNRIPVNIPRQSISSGHKAVITGWARDDKGKITGVHVAPPGKNANDKGNRIFIAADIIGSFDLKSYEPGTIIPSVDIWIKNPPEVLPRGYMAHFYPNKPTPTEPASGRGLSKYQQKLARRAAQGD